MARKVKKRKRTIMHQINWKGNGRGKERMRKSKSGDIEKRRRRKRRRRREKKRRRERKKERRKDKEEEKEEEEKKKKKEEKKKAEEKKEEKEMGKGKTSWRSELQRYDEDRQNNIEP